MVAYYNAFDLSFYNGHVDERAGQLMHNHLEKKAIAWLMKEYDGPRKYSILIKRMRARFVTKSKEDMTVENFIDLAQGKKTLDQYIEQFKVLRNGEEFSDNFLQIKFKKGLASQTLRMLLKTRSYATLESLIDDARTLNATDSKDTSGGATTARQVESTKKKNEKINDDKKDTVRCNSTRCTERGH